MTEHETRTDSGDQSHAPPTGRFRADCLPALRDRARRSRIPVDTRGQRVPAVVVHARHHVTGSHERAIYCELAIWTTGFRGLVGDFVLIDRPGVAARINTALDLPMGSRLTPDALLGVQVQLLLGRWPDGRWRVRRWQPLFADVPRPAQEALGLQVGVPMIRDAVIDDVEIDSTDDKTLKLSVSVEVPGADPVDVSHTTHVRRDTKIVGRTLIGNDGNWEFPPGNLLRERCSARLELRQGSALVNVDALLAPEERSA